jgi:hypothetical protein
MSDHQHLQCPECAEPATRRSPSSWTPAWGPAPAYSHLDGEPLCPVVGDHGYQPTEPVAITHHPAEPHLNDSLDLADDLAEHACAEQASAGSGTTGMSGHPDADDRVVTAAELEAMTPQERHAHSRASIVRDLDTLPAWYRDKTQARSQQTIARRDAQAADHPNPAGVPAITTPPHPAAAVDPANQPTAEATTTEVPPVEAAPVEAEVTRPEPGDLPDLADVADLGL